MDYKIDCILEGIHAGKVRRISEFSQLEADEYVCIYEQSTGKYRVTDSGMVENLAKNETLFAVMSKYADFRIPLTTLNESCRRGYAGGDFLNQTPGGWAAYCRDAIYPNCDAFDENSFSLAHNFLRSTGMRVRIHKDDYDECRTHNSRNFDEFMSYVATYHNRESWRRRSELIDSEDETPLEILQTYCLPEFFRAPMRMNPFTAFSDHYEYFHGDHNGAFFPNRLFALWSCVYGEPCAAGVADYICVLPLILKKYKPELYLSQPESNDSHLWLYVFLNKLFGLPKMAVSALLWLTFLPAVSLAQLYYMWEYNREVNKIRSLHVRIADVNAEDNRLLPRSVSTLARVLPEINDDVWTERLMQYQEEPPEIHLSLKKKPARNSFFVEQENLSSPSSDKDIVIPVNQENKKGIKVIWKTGAFFAGNNDRYMKEKIDEIYSHKAGL